MSRLLLVFAVVLLVQLAGDAWADVPLPDSQPVGSDGFNNIIGLTNLWVEEYIYAESLLTAQGLSSGQSIVGLNVRLHSGADAPASPEITCDDVSVTIGKAASDPEDISNTFANNLGPDVVLCYEGPVTWNTSSFNVTFFPFISCVNNTYLYEGGPLVVLFTRSNCSDAVILDYDSVADTNSVSKMSSFTLPTSGSPSTEILYVELVTTGSVSGDPHFVGFDGSRFNFDGIAGSVFNLITTSHFQLNMEIDAFAVNGVNGTWITALGIVAGASSPSSSSSSIIVSAVYGSILANGDVILDGATCGSYEFDDLRAEIVASEGRVSQLILSTSEVKVTVDVQYPQFSRPYLNVQVALLERFNGIHGVLGQTARQLLRGVAESTEKASKTFTIEGAQEDYLVADGLTGTDFVFNLFTGEKPPVEVRGLSDWVPVTAAFSF